MKKNGMLYVKIQHNGYSLFLSYKPGFYDYYDASCIRMSIPGLFLARDVGGDTSFYKEWFLENKYNSAAGNVIELDKKDGYIMLRDMYSEEKIPTELKMTCHQFLQLLDGWEQKVIKLKPKEVIIKYENDEFVIETKN